MNPKHIFLVEFCKLIGRLGEAAARGDTSAFLNLITSVRQLCDTIERTLRTRYVDPIEWDDEDL